MKPFDLGNLIIMDAAMTPMPLKVVMVDLDNKCYRLEQHITKKASGLLWFDKQSSCRLCNQEDLRKYEIELILKKIKLEIYEPLL